MAIQEQQVGSTGNIAEVKAASVLPVAATDGALVTVSRPDDPLLTALVNDGFITGQGGQLALGNNITLAVAGTGSLDVTGSRAVAMQIVPAAGTVTAGAVTFEGSNDGANWVTMLMYDKAAMANAPASTYTVVAATPRFFLGNVFFRYFRARISTGLTGTTSGLQCFTALMQSELSFAIQQVRMTDGTNQGPVGATVATGIYNRITDGTTQAAVKAASTAAVAADPGLVVTLSPNLPVPTVHTLTSAATTNATSVKASAGRVTALVLTNLTGTVFFFKMFQKATAPTVGTDIPVLTVSVPVSAVPYVLPLSDLGLQFGTGIAYSITNLIADTDATAITAGACKVMMNYI